MGKPLGLWIHLFSSLRKPFKNEKIKIQESKSKKYIIYLTGIHVKTVKTEIKTLSVRVYKNYEKRPYHSSLHSCVACFWN